MGTAERDSRCGGSWELRGSCRSPADLAALQQVSAGLCSQHPAIGPAPILKHQASASQALILLGALLRPAALRMSHVDAA